MTLPSAIAVNMLDMIGVGPFITLPLLLGAMGGPQALLGWIFGAGLAVCDGLVWAELGAALPEAGGTYAFLRTIYGRFGRFLGFLFVCQLMISAPLSVASGAVGVAQYAGFLWPALAASGLHWGQVIFAPGTAAAIGAVLAAVALLYRSLANLRMISYVLWATVMTLIAAILLTGLLHGHLAIAFDLPPHAFRLTPAFFQGLAAAMLIATYDFWGYYNVAFLGGEVRDPARTIPRAILGSIAIVAVLYLLLTIAVLSVVPWRSLAAAEGLGARQALIAHFVQVAYGARWGPGLSTVAAALVMVTGFASLFSLLLGYSRIPFAAARDGNFFAAFGRLHPTRGVPYVSLLTLGGMACLFCFLSLGELIAALVVLRIVVQFLLQHAGVMLLRRTQPELVRPFRLWLYPVPPLLAIAGFSYILLGRAGGGRQLALAGGVVATSASLYAVRSRLRERSAAKQERLSPKLER